MSYSPDQLRAEALARLSPALARRGFRLVGEGPSGLAWRRELSGKIIGILIVLGLCALGGLISADTASLVVGVCAAGAGIVLAYSRRPALVTVDFVRGPDGQVAINMSGLAEADKSRAIVEQLTSASNIQASPPPAAPTA